MLHNSRYCSELHVMNNRRICLRIIVFRDTHRSLEDLHRVISIGALPRGRSYRLESRTRPDKIEDTEQYFAKECYGPGLLRKEYFHGSEIFRKRKHDGVDAIICRR